MRFSANIYAATLYQLAVALVMLWLSRLGFYIYNADLIGAVSWPHLASLMWYGLQFDLSALAYFNALFVAIRFLPFAFAAGRPWVLATDWIYYVTNTVMLVVNIGDIPFFRYAGSRLRWGAVVDMLHEPNIGTIIVSYGDRYWWAFVMTVAVIALMVFLYGRVRVRPFRPGHRGRGMLPVRAGIFMLAAAVTFVAMRGSVSAGRPLSIGDAAWHIDRNPEINIVLNSPFCVLRSLSSNNEFQPYSLLDSATLGRVRDSLHRPAPGPSRVGESRPNIMVIVLESGGQLFIDRLNIVPGDTARHLMPFLDSIAGESLTAVHTIATGRRSNEGIASIFGGFPNFEPFIYMLSPYNANTVDAPARVLRDEGYATRFYFGGNRGSYSIDQFARSMGFDDVIDRQRYGNDDDFDGTWGIFDHAMGRYAAEDLTTLGQPFFAGWFTIDAHAPFTVPDDWMPDGYRHSEPSIQRSIEYTDRALRLFFETASRQPWYRNTIFVITADHGCRDLKGTRYDTPYVMYHIPFIVYTPDGSVAPARVDDRVMSQMDIAPTILTLAGYDKPYISPGTDLLDDSVPHYAANFVNNQFQVTGMRYVVQLDPSLENVTGVYDIAADPFMTAPATSYDRDEVDGMVLWLRAFVQDSYDRIINNRMSVITDSVP